MGGARAFVTGIGGQDGSYLAEQLLAEGGEVHGLLLPDEPLGFTPAAVTVHRGDVSDVAATRALLREVEPDEVYNLAAVSSVARSWSEPELTSLVNGHAAAALLESARLCQEATGRQVRVVQASSAEIFGDAPGPHDESTPIRPVNPYGAAKAFAHLAVGVQRHRDLHAVAVILYNHESPRRPRHFVTRKITSTVAAIARGEADTLTLGNLEARRDWGWAPEYVDAMVRAARHEVAQDYVVATGETHSVRDFVAAAFAAAGIDDWEGLVESDAALVRAADAAVSVGDASRARRDLGWAPATTFAEVVARMVRADLA
ncbi:GDP-mannose 4,6-dehydratase [Nocardioides perillae]|uniref:GDP-mannose 4,6-dehydratase n=1 Tax=Nocardioides perillae TaxID=1119534 RepID=A0A7Y9UV08_9ACTN|nr:GDPmannose 4,6-dehydratase [Nocardioides perillae]